VRNAAFLFAVAGLLTIGTFGQLQNSSKALDESELRRIEAETAKSEQQNASSTTDLLEKLGDGDHPWHEFKFRQ